MRKEREQEVISENVNVLFLRESLQKSTQNIGIVHRVEFENLLREIDNYYKEHKNDKIFTGRILSIINKGSPATYFEFHECPHGFPPRVALKFFNTIPSLSLAC